MKWIGLLFMGIVLAGCGTKEVVYIDRPVEVKVPVKCEIPLPEKPIVTIDAQGLKNTLKYTETLECWAKRCQGGKCDDVK